VAVANGRCAKHSLQRQRQPDLRVSSTRRGYGYEWRKTRAAFLLRNPQCEVCGRQATDVDHIIPRRDGGTDDWANLQALCHEHHSMKTGRGG